MLDPVDTLQRRQDFINEVCELASLCNWQEEEIRGLSYQLWEELVKVDNTALVSMMETLDQERSHEVWERGMEGIRYWLGLVLGIKIKYV